MNGASILAFFSVGVIAGVVRRWSGVLLGVFTND